MCFDNNQLFVQSQPIALDVRQNVQTGNGYSSSSGSDVTSSDNSYNSGGDWTNSDKSYNFEFGLSDNRRKEVADESGNVRGQVKLGMEWGHTKRT